MVSPGLVTIGLYSISIFRFDSGSGRLKGGGMEREWHYSIRTRKNTSSDGWELIQEERNVWRLTHVSGRSQQFQTSGGIFTAIDMSNYLLDLQL
jgi:hypothetical protein